MNDQNKIKQKEEKNERKKNQVNRSNEYTWNHHLIWDGTNCKVAGWQNISVKCNIFISDWQDFFSGNPCPYVMHFAFVMFIFLFFILRCWRKNPKLCQNLQCDNGQKKDEQKNTKSNAKWRNEQMRKLVDKSVRQKAYATGCLLKAKWNVDSNKNGTKLPFRFFYCFPFPLFIG